MKKLTQATLRKMADTLVGMSIEMIQDAKEEGCSPEELSRLSAAFSCALDAVHSLAPTKEKAKAAPKVKEKTQAEETAVCGKIILPPVLEGMCDE